MAISYSNRVTSAINYALTRMGYDITYKRLQAPGGWAPSGISSTNPDIWWEQPSVSAIIYDANIRDVEESGGRVRIGDKAFAFLASSFTDHSDYEHIKFSSGSTEFTAEETITGATSGATATVIDWYEDSGTWAGGDAVGVVWVSVLSGTFNASENINGSSGGNNMATTTAANASGGTDDVEPKVGDQIIYEGDTFKIMMEGEGAYANSGLVIQEDITKTTFTVWGRSEDS